MYLHQSYGNNPIWNYFLTWFVPSQLKTNREHYQGIIPSGDIPEGLPFSVTS